LTINANQCIQVINGDLLMTSRNVIIDPKNRPSSFFVSWENGRGQKTEYRFFRSRSTHGQIHSWEYRSSDERRLTLEL